MTKPEERDLTYDDIALLVSAARRSNKDPEVVVAAHCNVDPKTARDWVRKVGAK